MFHIMGDIGGKEVFDFGCGEGELSTQFARLGALVTGVDISPELVEIANKRAELDAVAQRIRFRAADVLVSPLSEAQFDILVCHAVLHHVDVYRTFPLLLRCVKPGGAVIIVEPIALSPFLQRIRDALPIRKDVSPGEHQLNESEFSLIRESIRVSDTRYFNFLGRLSRFLPHANEIDEGHAFTRFALLSLLSLDRFLIATFPFLRKYSGTVVIAGHKQC